MLSARSSWKQWTDQDFGSLRRSNSQVRSRCKMAFLPRRRVRCLLHALHRRVTRCSPLSKGSNSSRCVPFQPGSRMPRSEGEYLALQLRPFFPLPTEALQVSKPPRCSTSCNCIHFSLWTVESFGLGPRNSRWTFQAPCLRIFQYEGVGVVMKPATSTERA